MILVNGQWVPVKEAGSSYQHQERVGTDRTAYLNSLRETAAHKRLQKINKNIATTGQQPLGTLEQL